jgi:hypothetical protein
LDEEQTDRLIDSHLTWTEIISASTTKSPKSLKKRRNLTKRLLLRINLNKKNYKIIFCIIKLFDFLPNLLHFNQFIYFNWKWAIATH